MISHWQCGPVVWEPPIPLASVLSCPVVCAKSGKERVRLSRWRHSSCTIESRIDRAENAMGLGLSPILGVPGAVSLVTKIFKNGQERGDATRIELVPRLLRILVYVLGTKNIFVPNQRPVRIYRAAFVIFNSYTKELTCKLDCSRYARVKLSPVLDVWLVQESFLREEFSVKISPKFYSTSFIRSSCVTEEKNWTTNLQTSKGEKITPARAW